MRLQKLVNNITLTIVMFAIFANSATVTFAQQNPSVVTTEKVTSEKVSTTKAATQQTTTICDQKQDSIVTTSSVERSNIRRGKTVRKPRKPQPPTRIIYLSPPAPTPAPPPVTAIKADFADMVVNAGEEAKQTGAITLSSGNDAEEAFPYMNVSASPNLQAWFSGLELHVYSPNGGNGKVLITDKNGKVLDTVAVTGDLATASTTDKNIAQIALNTAQTRDYTFWILVVEIIGFILVILLLLFLLIRLGTLSTINSNIVDIYDRLGDVDERIVGTNTRMEGLRADMDEVLHHYGVRRTVVVEDSSPGPIIA